MASKELWHKAKVSRLAGASWQDIEFETSIPVATLKSRASREKWQVQAAEVATAVQRGIVDIVAKRILKEAAEIAADHYDVLELGIVKAQNMLDGYKTIGTMEGPLEVPAIQSGQDIKAWAQALVLLTNAQRTAANISDPNRPGTSNPGKAGGGGVIEVPYTEDPPEPPPELLAPDPED